MCLKASIVYVWHHSCASRLHVNIFDTVNSQFTIPETVVTRPQASGSNTAAKSDLVFNYDPSPFAFWITRRSAPHSTPLFDTRPSSLPPTPIPSVMAGDPSAELDGFPLVFENQYIQVRLDICFVERNFERSSVGIGSSFGSQRVWPRGGHREQRNPTRRGHRW